MVSQDSKVHNFASTLFLLLIIIRPGSLAEIRWSVCVKISEEFVCVSFSRTDIVLCKYYLFVWLNWNFWLNSQWMALPIQSCLVLHTFWVHLLHSLFMYLMVSSLSPQNIHLMFCFVLSILAWIWSILIALFYVAIRRDSDFFIKFLFLSHVQVSSREMLLISRLKRP